MPAGRPRKPKGLKKLQGTYRKDRDPADAPEAPPGIPDLPDGWGDGPPWGDLAVEEYYRIGPVLLELGVLSRVDRAALLLYCDAYARWIYYRDQVTHRNDTQSTKGGFESQSAHSKMMNDASKDLEKRLKVFGLSPADRAKVVRTKSKTKAPGEELMSGPKLA